MYQQLSPSPDVDVDGEITYSGDVLYDSDDDVEGSFLQADGRPGLQLHYPSGSHVHEADDVPIIDLDGPSSPTNKQVNLYFRLLVRCPFSIPFLLMIAGLVGVCGWASYHYHPPPDFDDPTEGFETRGTEIRAKAWTLENLWNQNFKGDIALTPNQTLALMAFGINDTATGNSIINWIIGQGGNDRLKRDVASHRGTPQDSRVYPQRARRKRATRGNLSNKTAAGGGTEQPEGMADGIAKYCASGFIDLKTADKFVFESTDGSDIFSASALRSICTIEDLYLTPIQKNHGCSLRSLPFYVAGLRNKECQQLTDDDITLTKILLKTCAPYYYNSSDNKLKDKDSLLEERTSEIPKMCIAGSDVYMILYYLTPIGYMKPGSSEEKSDILKVTVAYTDSPAWDGESFYKQVLMDKRIENGNVHISAVGFSNQQSVKYDIFNEYLLKDMKYFIVAAGLVLVIMILYLRSILLMLATLINVGMSFVLAYFVYFFVCRMTFFPFMNILAVLVLIAVGADDVFIFYDTWEKAKKESGSGPSAMGQAMSKAFSHAALSVFVTSLTTASAFFANFASHITAIRCFGIFAGLAILCNFALMVSWTPAIIVLVDYLWIWCKRVFLLVTTKICNVSGRCDYGTKCCSTFKYFSSALTKFIDHVYGTMFPYFIVKGWYVWIAFYLLLGIGGSIVVFVKPRLQLPSSSDFQLFPSNNLLEAWDLRFTKSFQAILDQEESGQSDMLPVYFIFGFKATDDGNWLDPDDEGGPPRRDEAFDFYSSESQVFLVDFFEKLKNSSFIGDYYGGTQCGLVSYAKVIENYCSNGLQASFLGQCCQQKTPPYSREQLLKCTPGMELIIQKKHWYGDIGHPIFDRSNAVIGYRMHVMSKHKLSMSYEVMDIYYNEIKSFFEDAMTHAPNGMKTAFFTARYDFTFYDLQNGLSKGTLYSIVLSLGVAFLVMLFTSGNILITLYAIITIALSIICTVAAIVLIGWDLNILESVAISLAVGLSIDFTIHYGVAYTLSKAKDPEGRVTESFGRVGMAVAMAALTTFAAGAAMLPSHVLAYTKLGIFLMLVMTFSWIYATFFFQSVCRIIGPKGNFCQVSLACCKARCKRPAGDENDADLHSLASIDSNDSFLITF